MDKSLIDSITEYASNDICTQFEKKLCNYLYEEAKKASREKTLLNLLLYERSEKFLRSNSLQEYMDKSLQEVLDSVPKDYEQKEAAFVLGLNIGALINKYGNLGMGKTMAILLDRHMPMQWRILTSREDEL